MRDIRDEIDWSTVKPLPPVYYIVSGPDWVGRREFAKRSG